MVSKTANQFPYILLFAEHAFWVKKFQTKFVPRISYRIVWLTFILDPIVCWKLNSKNWPVNHQKSDFWGFQGLLLAKKCRRIIKPRIVTAHTTWYKISQGATLFKTFLLKMHIMQKNWGLRGRVSFPSFTSRILILDVLLSKLIYYW